MGPHFTWTNKQANPIRSNIDRVLMSTEREQKFSLSTLSSLTRLGSDHCPLLLDTREMLKKKPRQFYFEKHWLKNDQFMGKVTEKWQEARERSPEGAYSMDRWRGQLSKLRQFLKGWGNNLRGEFR